MVLNEVSEGREGTVKDWKTVIDGRVKEIGASKWRMGMERKTTLNWYKTKKMPKIELFYDGRSNPVQSQNPFTRGECKNV